ncbi:MAG: magnesium transporter CorA family protein [Candidatus Nitrosopumilus limneticus]|nr:putative CorA ion transporter (Cobalt/magnesium transport protein) [Candidatus Nitrosopumilus limneticus]MDC4211783.1 magnesium transporter CorA family protein [Candidatus Nitrosopumilus limneticus]MDC4213448.1 magnesium transporter CorA family protein [Candidatus Nitrosopumilus limneticus]MDC4214395.1 magnesium transporter CorA family protein [Candidatus Nitrosopumilus limneticus]MDC4216357.1 magnesium transporter CorA family protein [Candidatus Nitrosopumilus limneticus]
MKRGFISNRLHGGKKLSNVPLERKIQTIDGNNFQWIDLQNPDRNDVEKLAEKYNFNELNVEDCMTKFELPKLDSYDDHFFVILHFPPPTQKVGILKNSQLSIFMGKNFLVTVHQGELESLVQLIQACILELNDKSKKKLLGESSGDLLHEIVDTLVDDLLHTSRKIIANLDEMEDNVFDESKNTAKSIALLRREINRLRRISIPLKKFVLEIAKDVKKISGNSDDDLGLYFDDVIDHIDKVIETLDESKETMEIYKDTDFVLSTEKTNKVLAVLTMIFTLAIPSTIIGTFYGMNVNLPGGIEENPMILGPFTTFVVIIITSAIPAIIMLIYFKKLGWISK